MRHALRLALPFDICLVAGAAAVLVGQAGGVPLAGWYASAGLPVPVPAAGHRIGPVPPGVAGVPGPDASPITMSADGRVVGRVGCDLAIVDLASGRTKRLNLCTGEPPAAAGARPQSNDSVISADGGLVAFLWATGEADQVELRTVRADGTGLQALREVRPAERFTLIAVHGRARTILAVTGPPEARELQALSIEDGTTRRVKKLAGAAPRRFTLAPGGRYLAYDGTTAGAPHRAIYVVDTRTGREAVVAGHAGDDVAPVWDPDGSRLYFASDRAGLPALWVQAMSGGRPSGSPELVGTDVGQFEPFGITRDGRLLYREQTAFAENLVAVRVGGAAAGK